ncbi:MAG TPA: DUF4129 domain-containing protein, partial [Thermomicrobiales bacterium]|nr:DUF4129 domain-containing protein [Thermomicrobiales bacterium]
PRRDPETADEYQPDIATQFTPSTGVPAAIATITDLYRHTRYSGEPATEQEAARVLDAWRVVEQSG